MQREADEQQGADQLGKKASHTWHATTGIRRKWSKCLSQGWLMMGCSGSGMRAGVVGLVAVAFSNEVGTITTLSKCSSKLAMLTGNGQRTLAVR